MPVIGRLDEQVEEVLITPLERRRGPDEPAAARGDTPAPPEPPGQAQPRETPRAPGELPVWLL